MGNVSDKEEIDNGSDDSKERSDGEANHRSGGARRSRSLELIRGSPPDRPYRSLSPLLFVPQVFIVS
ncbi:hypothetical protein IEQ34_001922 [Dendrobium chrysotoxum]|uniref:Uncharacterized protein n=1 Tax=Dendrobium chrysotoxum TaxID=161865 RepID=A0AAV7H3J6_DENCH|nr:hypothetical protein IEQ34_001922 [Dendrobium chrysotoxum]